MRARRIKSVESIRQDLIEQVNEAFEEVQGLANSNLPKGLNAIDIRNWLVQDVRADELWCGRFIGTSGSGPWDIDEFDTFVASLGLTIGFVPNPEFDIVILGENSFDEDGIRGQIDTSIRNQTIFLSQELFVASIIKNEYPFDSLTIEAIDELLDTHPGLSFAASCGYEPQQSISAHKILEWDADKTLANRSPLGVFGYTAREGAMTEAQRRQTLDAFYLARKLPLVDNEQDRKRWGAPSSAQRLYSMNNFLAWLAFFNGSEAPLAREKWLTDLEWLKAKYYKPKMGFEWKSSLTSRSKSAGPYGGPTASDQVSAKPRLNPQAPWPFSFSSSSTGKSPRG